MLCFLILSLALRLLLRVLLASQATVTPMPRLLLTAPAPPTGPLMAPPLRRPLLVAMALRALPRRPPALLMRAPPRRRLTLLLRAPPMLRPAMS